MRSRAVTGVADACTESARTAGRRRRPVQRWPVRTPRCQRVKKGAGVETTGSSGGPFDAGTVDGPAAERARRARSPRVAAAGRGRRPSPRRRRSCPRPHRAGARARAAARSRSPGRTASSRRPDSRGRTPVPAALPPWRLRPAAVARRRPQPVGATRHPRAPAAEAPRSPRRATARRRRRWTSRPPERSGACACAGRRPGPPPAAHDACRTRRRRVQPTSPPSARGADPLTPEPDRSSACSVRGLPRPRAPRPQPRSPAQGRRPTCTACSSSCSSAAPPTCT